MSQQQQPKTFVAVSSLSGKLSSKKSLTINDIKKSNNYFEILFETIKDKENKEIDTKKLHKVYIDLDGYFEGTDEDFMELNGKIIGALYQDENIIGIRTSSMLNAEKWEYGKLIETTNKLSYIITYNSMATCAISMKNYIINNELPNLQSLLQGIIPLELSNVKDDKPNTLYIDTGVYNKNRKMRCPNAYKYEEQPNRKYKIIKGSIEDNVIQLTDTSMKHIGDENVLEYIQEELPIQVELPKQLPKDRKPVEFNETLREVCETIGEKSNYWYNTTDWKYILYSFKTENWSYEAFDEFSEKYGGNMYNEPKNKMIWDKAKKLPNYNVNLLWGFLKKCDYQKWSELQPKRNDFFELLTNVSNLDLAVLYNQIHPTKYAYSKTSKWWEYNNKNLLVNTGDQKPVSLINNIGYSLREYFNEQRKLLDMNDKHFEQRNKEITKIYQKLGVSSFCKGIIDFLPDLYYNNDIDDLVDNNTNIIAFDNMLYDLNTGKCRDIKPDDYISRTCGYDFIDKSNEKVRTELMKVIVSIFPDKDTREYYLKITALSFFTNRFESFYCLSGQSRNGKGLLDGLIKKSLGKYHYTAEPTFLTTIIKAGIPNPSLSQCNGIRYLSVSEPDNGSSECVLNTEFVKALSGRDKITSRGLYEANKTFENRFTVFLQCNNKPTLSKLDKAIVERLRCVPFTERFLSNPNPHDTHQHPCNEKLKDILTQQEYVNEFMLIMFEIAYINRNISGKDLKPSELCKDMTNEYVEENNVFKFWFEANYKKMVYPSNFKDLPKEEKEKYPINRIKTSTLLTEFNAGKSKVEQTTAKKLRNALTFNDIEVTPYNGINCIKGYEKIDTKENETTNCLIDELDKTDY
jgi:phage/plasmid-associated DNA primase